MTAPALAFNSQQYNPWPETVAVTSVATNGSPVTETVTDACVLPQANREGSPSRGVYTKWTIDVTIGFADVSFVPKPADTMLWNGGLFTILTVQPYDYLQYYRLTAVNLILANQLVQSGNLARPTNAQDATGKLALNVYTTLAAGFPCRLQPLGGTATDIMKRRTVRQLFTAILGVQLTAQAKDVFTVDGQAYSVLDFKLPRRIDELMTLTCELIDSPASIPIFSALPTVTGGITVVQTLTAVPGTVSGSPTFAYQWFSAGVAIAGATGSSYVTQTSDIGNLISVLFVATGSNGFVSRAMSNTVGPIQASGGGSVPNMFGDEFFG